MFWFIFNFVLNLAIWYVDGNFNPIGRTDVVSDMDVTSNVADSLFL